MQTSIDNNIISENDVIQFSDEDNDKSKSKNPKIEKLQQVGLHINIKNNIISDESNKQLNLESPHLISFSPVSRNAYSMHDINQPQQFTFSKKVALSIGDQEDKDPIMEQELYSPQNLKKREKIQTISTIHLSNQQNKFSSGQFYCQNFKPTKVMQYMKTSSLSGDDDDKDIADQTHDDDLQKIKHLSSVYSNQQQSQQDTFNFCCQPQNNNTNHTNEEEKLEIKENQSIIKLHKVQEGTEEEINKEKQMKYNGKKKKTVKFLDQQNQNIDDNKSIIQPPPELQQEIQQQQIKQINNVSSPGKVKKQPKEIPILQQIQINDIKDFIFQPIQKDFIIQFYIIREVSGLSFFAPKFHFYLASNNKYIISARKEAISVSADYLISENQKEFSKKSLSYLGRVKADIVGSTFQIFDKGENPDSCKELDKIRQELGLVSYSSDKGFSLKKMQVGIPKIQQNGKPTEIRLMSNRQSFFNIFSSKLIHQQMQLFYSKKPVYNEAQKAYVLDFKGRATIASVKNFQIAKYEDDSNISLQMGKCDKQKFNVDAQYPFSPFQAFAICLTAFDYDFYK